MEAKIVFGDGTEIIAEQNGSSFIVDTKPQFPDNMDVVTITSEEQAITLHYAFVQECAGIDDRYWFTLLEESPQNRTIKELRAENELLAGAITELAELIGGEA